MIEIKEKSECCGCSACVQRCPKHCIVMKIDDEGFWYPHVDSSICINCGLCENVCPCLNDKKLTTAPLKKVYTFRHSDNIKQQLSTSGGACSYLSEWIIKEGGVVFGAKFNDLWDVVHGYTETIEGLIEFRMSKYVQSDIGDSFLKAEQFLKQGRLVLFVGTPCQIHGLKLFLRKEYDNLITVDFICHGVPSPGVWRHYLKETLARKGKKNSVSSSRSKSIISELDALSIKGIQFRNKRLGWEKFSFVLRWNFAEPMCDGKKNTVSPPLKDIEEDLVKNPYLRGFIHDIFLRRSCYNCKSKSFTSGSDITLGDFWGIKHTYPRLYDKNGISAVIVNTQKGVKVLEDSSMKNMCHIALYDKLLQYNKSIETSVKPHKFRNVFFMLKDFIAMRYLVGGIQAVNKVYKILYRL